MNIPKVTDIKIIVDQAIKVDQDLKAKEFVAKKQNFQHECDKYESWLIKQCINAINSMGNLKTMTVTVFEKLHKSKAHYHYGHELLIWQNKWEHNDIDRPFIKVQKLMNTQGWYLYDLTTTKSLKYIGEDYIGLKVIISDAPPPTHNDKKFISYKEDYVNHWHGYHQMH